VQWNDRAHFFALMSQVMRRVLINHARDRKRLKRGGDAERVSLDESGVIGHARDLDLEALEDALSDLESADPMKAAIVELRFYGGLTLEETAQHLRISKATVVRHWRLARAWLYHELDVE
jgi:RNA polymerase sigma factor (TIGR02999 family)